MKEKRSIDAAGAAGLILFATILAFNQVVIKLTSDGIAPVFQAGLRSGLALVLLSIWIWVRGIPVQFTKFQFKWALVSGAFFAAEFVFLFLALDLTTVSRASILFYSMPLWLGIAGHFLLPGEEMSRIKALGLILAFAGVIIALTDRSGTSGSLLGDLLALSASVFWAGIALLVRITPLSQVKPELQLGTQLAVSAPVLMLVAPSFGPILRDLGPQHFWLMAYQVVFVASFGFLFWFQLIKIYRASGVASFSFLSPVLAVMFGWFVLGEPANPSIWAALICVAGGLILINRK